jgi:hypothetical protein
MHHAAPQLRQSTANILTDLGWFAGTFHVPLHQSLVDFLAGGVGVIKATRVRIPGEEARLPFVGIRRDSILVVEPTQGDELIETAGSIGRTTTRRVGCLLAEGLLTGALEVLVNVRVSDFLRQQPGLVVLSDCRLVPFGQPADSPKARKLRIALVNLGRVPGLAEWENKST